MRQAGQSVHGLRVRGLIVVLWRAALRIQEGLALTESDLNPNRGSVLVKQGKGGRRREVGTDSWAWDTFRPFLAERLKLPVGTAVLRYRRTDPRTGLVSNSGAR